MKRLPFLPLFLFLSLLLVGCEEECQEDPQPNCTCTMVYDPVCGCNGETYGNACEAECAGIEDYTQGSC